MFQVHGSPGQSTSKISSGSAATATTGSLSDLSSSIFGLSPVSNASADETFEGRILEVPNLRVFTCSELRCATRNFKFENILGEGGFGRVYKGVVEEKTLNPSKSGTGMVVAVKKLNPESMQGLEEWQVTQMLSSISSFSASATFCFFLLVIAVGSKFPRKAFSSEPCQAHGLLLGRQGASSCV